jgi:hypothetical protein
MNATICPFPEGAAVAPMNPSGEEVPPRGPHPDPLPNGEGEEKAFFESQSESPVRLAADVSLKVPRERDMEIYEQVVFARMSQREVAEMHEISQPRVHQILQEMAAWMADNTPGFVAALTPEQRLRLVHYNVTKQLEHHQECLMEAWRESVGLETVRRTTIVGLVRTTVEVERPTRGNYRYVHAAGRVSQALLKLAGWTPGTMVSSAPQDSPYWQVEEEEPGVRSQDSEEEETTGEEQEVEGPKPDLSSFAERARNSNLTRAEMEAITAEQEAVYEAIQAKLKRLEAQNRDAKNSLSLGSGPLLPEDGEVGNLCPAGRRPRSGEEGCSHAERGNKSVRREFLRGEPPAMSIREVIELPAKTGG